MALKYSTHQHGTVQDADFWYLIQSSGMQLLSVLTVVIFIWTRNDLTFESWSWSSAFISLAILCPFGAIPCYLYYQQTGVLQYRLLIVRLKSLWS